MHEKKGEQGRIISEVKEAEKTNPGGSNIEVKGKGGNGSKKEGGS